MDKNKQIRSLTPSDLSELEVIGGEGYYAVDVSRICFSELLCDPWEQLRRIKNSLRGTRLMLCLQGQSLLGDRIFADDTVDRFVERAVEKGIAVLRIYDALNDPRNLESPLKAAKRYGAHAEAAMVYTESPVHSVSYFAGYAAQLASMGADSLCICKMSNEFTARELVEAVKDSSKLPVSVSALSEEIGAIAIDAGADSVDIYKNEAYPDELFTEIGNVRADAGFPPLASPVAEIIAEQARINLCSADRYSAVTEEFKLLVRGGFGRTPAPIAQEFVSRICGNDPLILVRPADMIKPELGHLTERISCWLEQEEDVLTYALFGDKALGFFEQRNARRYSLDAAHAKSEKGIHVV